MKSPVSIVKIVVALLCGAVLFVLSRCPSQGAVCDRPEDAAYSVPACLQNDPEILAEEGGNLARLDDMAHQLAVKLAEAPGWVLWGGIFGHVLVLGILIAAVRSDARHMGWVEGWETARKRHREMLKRMPILEREPDPECLFEQPPFPRA